MEENRPPPNQILQCQHSQEGILYQVPGTVAKAPDPNSVQWRHPHTVSAHGHEITLHFTKYLRTIAQTVWN